MALINFFQQDLLKICLSKFSNFVALASTKSTSKDNNGCTDLEVTSQSSNESCYPEPIAKPLENPEDIRKRQLQRCKIIIRGTEDYSLISGVPLEITCSRPARIHQPTKNAQQQGTRHLGHWEIDFDTKERWDNPLIGWCSSGDPISNVKMNFSTKEQAIDYCKKNKLTYWVQGANIYKKFKMRSYASNFHQKNRTRVSTK